MSTSLEDWNRFLSDLESEVTRINSDLDAGGAFASAVLDPWAPPKHLDTLPVEYLDRAQAVNSALNDLELRTTAEREVLREEIQRVGSVKTKQKKGAEAYNDPTYARYIDRSV